MSWEKLSAEKLDEIKIKGGSSCCIGGKDDGCDCTGEGNAYFASTSNVWIARMDDNQVSNQAKEY